MVFYLKLVRTPKTLFFAATFKIIFPSLYTPIASHECHAWF